MGCLRIMSSKKVNMETKSKSSQSRKNRRRSTRNANVTNGEAEDPKERCGKRPRDINAKENADCNIEEGPDSDVYKVFVNCQFIHLNLIWEIYINSVHRCG